MSGMHHSQSLPGNSGTGGFRNLKGVQQVLMPRCVYAGLEEGVTSYSIHGFRNASEKAYCAANWFLK